MTYKSIIFKVFNGTLVLLFFLTSSCGIYKPADARKIDPNVNEESEKVAIHPAGAIGDGKLT